MKHTIRFIILIFALVMAGAGNAWAISESDIIFNVQPNKNAGTVSVTGISGMTVTISAVPATGYSIDASHIIAEKMVDAMAPRRAPGMASQLTITDNGSNSYSFTIPTGYTGAYVTVNFFKPSVGFTQITSLSQITDMNGSYQLTADVSGVSTSLGEFTGTLDGGLHKIIGSSAPLFSSTSGDAVIRNIIFEDVNISISGDAGAITGNAGGNTRIYNCGILPSSTERDNDGNITGFSGSSISGSGNVGSFVGTLNGNARVINCYSYANITGGSIRAGIVGYNSYASKSSSVSGGAIQTMVMNCMFYGDINTGGTISPIYGGLEISNEGSNNENDGRLNNYNYFRYESPFSKNNTTSNQIITKYNRALPAEERFLRRFEFYRNLLNSNRELAAAYIGDTPTETGSGSNLVKRYHKEKMAKWVLDKSIAPYPILKEQGIYPSVVNYDSEYTNDETGRKISRSSVTERNRGKALGTISVNISKGSGAPEGASITTSSLTLQCTDKDFNNYNYNYNKVQLPYYNEVGTGNYTSNKVVTGWIVRTSSKAKSFGTANYDYPNYNLADRSCTVGRVYSQGAYFDVPEGASSISIEAYWGNAVYVSDGYHDSYSNDDDYGPQGLSDFGKKYVNKTEYYINPDDNSTENKQKVYTNISDAITALPDDASSVYDNAVVLVGNFHRKGTPSGGDKPFTIMSADLDHDNEPDYSLIIRSGKQEVISPIRFDFINAPGVVMAHKKTSTTQMGIIGNMKPKGWFEVTNTAVIRFSQMEYDYGSKTLSPLILLGGVVEQFVSTNANNNKNEASHTKYIHVGSNVWFKLFSNGCHMDKTSVATPHRPISVTGGEYEKFYLSGYFQPNAPKADNADDRNAECYIDGGKFGEVAGAGQEQIDGNVTWDINHADIESFFGGGINEAKPVTGDINVTMKNSHVRLYCGGPKFGNMTGVDTPNNTSDDKTIRTTAESSTFGNFYGAGYGGTAIYRDIYSPGSDKGHNRYGDVNYSWSSWLGDEHGYFRGKYEAGKGIAIGFETEHFEGSSTNTVARLYVNYATMSVAKTNSVTSELTGCTIQQNFYGGGNLGGVNGDITSTLTNCTVNGSAFGAGCSATPPTADVMDKPIEDTNFIGSYYNTNTGSFEPTEYPNTQTFTWSSRGDNSSNTLVSEGGANYIHTEADLENLGTVTGKVTLNIEDNTSVGGSVYGGGEESGVDGDTEVTVTSGTIGSEGQGGVEYGNVYGGGKGKRDKVSAGQVKGSTRVLISQAENKTTRIYHNVYGGGAYGSVGDFEYDNTTGMPTGLKTGASENSGKTYVEITGGTFGWNGKENGMVFGSSRGDVGAPGSIEDQMAWVYETDVKIGTSGSGSVFTTPTIKGSVYGGGENGHNFNNSNVYIYSGTIGIPTGTPIGELSGAYYPYRGNVYGGGCGTDMYYTDPTGVENPYDGNGDAYNSLAGIVRGTATVNISGGYVVHNVYGAGAMGSVGNADDATSGKTTVNITGGRIGYDGERNGNVFGAARGEYGISTVPSNNLANVRESEVIINYATTPTADNEGKTEQLITGSVFGGGEAGIVKESVAVNMTGGLLLKDIYGGGALADTQTSNWDASANSGAGGWAAGKTSASSTTTVRLTGGTIVGEAYGGGLGEIGATKSEDKPAYVYGDVLLDLNGTTTSGDTGTPVAADSRGCAVHEVFGCNNSNGTPMGKVVVHVYATQNKAKTQIGNTTGETPVTDAKVKGSYDVIAVYGGGNLAAYEPAGGKNTTNSTKVIIDGCGTTSIQQVYGGGNAASTPATEVTVNGTYEIEEVFGGGNGKDDIVINNETKPNPGANVGFYAYEDNVTGKTDTKENRATYYGYGTGAANVNIFGGTIHRVFGGSNTKGNVRYSAVTMLEDQNECAFCVDEAYGGGKSAPMDAEAKLLMACIPGLKNAYGGAEAADIQGNVTLNISNGTFDRVFGGNNLSGTISGSITVNVEEVGCKPVIIGELYGGGNQAGYSVYGYNSDGSLIESGTTPLYSDPQVNVKSFTSIGNIYGGGYGSGAKMVGNPTVNVNVANGKWYNDNVSVVGDNEETPNHYPIPSHAKGKIGAINNVFGGGNAAMVKGNTLVNIGTLSEVYVVKDVTVGDSVTDYYTRNNDGTYSAATGTAVEGTTYYEKKDVLGVDIRGNVYGGGNNAEVTGNTNVNIGKKAE